MGKQFHAAPSNRGYVPAFSVEKLEGKFSKNVATRDAKSFGMETSEVESDRGWLVTFPRGHSIHVETFAELKRMGFDATTVPLVDEEGDIVGSIPNKVGKRKVDVDA